MGTDLLPHSRDHSIPGCIRGTGGLGVQGESSGEVLLALSAQNIDRKHGFLLSLHAAEACVANQAYNFPDQHTNNGTPVLVSMNDG